MGLIPRSGRSPGGRHEQPIAVFWPGESSGQRSLASYSPWGCRVGLNQIDLAQDVHGS